MRRDAKLFVLGLLAGVLAANSAHALDRPSADILKELDALKAPSFDPSRRQEQGYVQKFLEERDKYMDKRGELAMELFKAAPDNARVPNLLNERWQAMANKGKFDELLKEAEGISAHGSNKPLQIAAAFAVARVKLMKSEDGKPDLSGIDAFAKLAPKDQRVSGLLYSATFSTKDEAVKKKLEDRLLKDYPDSMYVSFIQGARRQREQIGKPFELEFSDAVKGSTVSVKSLKGKVVVVDFWATWCGPCVAEMPKMKEIYAQYHDKGVEFIGVSLDQPKDKGGLEALLKYVDKNEIKWPQYYQGNGWESDFSKKWGINAIPAMFVVDAEGKLYSVEARGKLETLIPELLQKAKDAGAGGQ